MSTETVHSPRALAGAWVRPVVLALSCLVIGFVAGWFLRGGGATSALPKATFDTKAQETPPQAQTVTQPQKPLLSPRAQVHLAVLNASGRQGAAATAAAKAAKLGYPSPVAANAPAGSGPTAIYYRPGARLAAARAATDIGLPAVPAPLPQSGPLVSTTSSAQVIVVLGR